MHLKRGKNINAILVHYKVYRPFGIIQNVQLLWPTTKCTEILVYYRNVLLIWYIKKGGAELFWYTKKCTTILVLY